MIYVIYHYQMGYYGFSRNKKIIKKFKRQRNMSQFKIVKYYTMEEARSAEKEICGDYDEIFTLHGHPVTWAEEEMFILAVDEITTDFNRTASALLYYSQFLRLSEEERLAVDRFGRLAYNITVFLRSDSYLEGNRPEILDIGRILSLIK